MAIRFDTSRVTIAISAPNVKPDVFINSTVGHVICHLTQGFNETSFPTGQGDAFTAAAHMPLIMAPTDTLSGWDFGFVQFARANLCRIFYAGRRRSGGSIGVTVHVPPALPSQVALDGFSSASIPWFRDPMLSFARPIVNAGWGDHPGLKVQLKLRNSNTNTDNLLFQIQDEREFWSIFSAKDPAGTLRYIAHFQWRVRWEFEFNWIGDKVFKRKTNSSFTIVQRKVDGPPTDTDVVPLLADPKAPRMSDLFVKALIQAIRGARGPNRSENTSWFTTVPRDFFSTTAAVDVVTGGG
jgi:hypothetical protein